LWNGSSPPIQPSCFCQSLLTVGYSYQGKLLSSLGDQAAAEASYRKALATANTIAGEDSADLESHLSIAKLHAALGVILSRSLRYTEARNEYTASLASFDELLKARPQDAEAIYYAAKVREYVAALDACHDGAAYSPVKHFELPTLVS
jgi:tetratricopeptide (TPR) repeat protein